VDGELRIHPSNTNGSPSAKSALTMIRLTKPMERKGYSTAVDSPSTRNHMDGWAIVGTSRSIWTPSPRRYQAYLQDLDGRKASKVIALDTLFAHVGK